MYAFILGSASPRRRSLLTAAGLSFTVQIAQVDEDTITTANPQINVRQRAELKANGLAIIPAQPTIIITADTTVALENEMLNKPSNIAEARHMLQRLRGRVHQVHTAVTLRKLPANHLLSTIDTADVQMRHYTDEEIEKYIATGDPFDKAGGYAIQHPVFQPVAKLNGCYLTVMGLSLCVLNQMFQEWSLGVTISHTDQLEAHQKFASCPHLF